MIIIMAIIAGTSMTMTGMKKNKTSIIMMMLLMMTTSSLRARCALMSGASAGHGWRGRAA
jgi:hypothetical protein